MKKSLGFILVLTMIMSLAFSLSCMTTFADDVIEINNVDDLYNVRNNMSGNYKLMCDIDMSEEVATGGKYNYSGKGWEPFGATTSTEFTGTFDGNGHTISGMSMVGQINVYSVLFWKNAGTIKNLSVKGSINGNGSASPNNVGEGMIVGVNTGTITNCRVDASVISSRAGYGSGLIAARNDGTISKCLTSGSIKGAGYTQGYLGGICGIASGDASISESANMADIDGRGSNAQGTLAGIAGKAPSTTTIDNCYNTGEIIGYNSASSTKTYTRYPYGIASEATISNCYNIGSIWYSDYTISSSATQSGAQIGGTSKTNCYFLGSSGEGALNETQMTMEHAFVGFDFENTWIIDPYADYKYPQLREKRQDLGREIDMIELKSAPDKITYKTGDEFDPTGCVVTVLYKDNGSEDINVTKDMLSGYDMSTAGIQDVVLNYRGYTLSFKINVNQRPEITGMELTSEPLKTTFIRGTQFDFTGAIAQIKYQDGTTEDFPIKAEDCTGGDINTSGDYEITYTKFGYSVTFNVSVVPVREKGIHIGSLPNKTSYIEGEDIDTTGLVVCVDYNTGESAQIDDYTIADYDNTAGVQTINVQYKDFEATFEVSFAEKKVVSIEVTKQPDKTEYVYGQLFDPTGMIVTANLDNGKTEEVTDYVVSPMEDRNGMQDLTISYAGKTTYVTVFVTQRALDSISVTTKPYKLTYIEGSEFDPEGMVVTAKYNDDTTEVITDYTMTKLGRTPGNKTIVISYGGKTTTLAVTVIAKTVVSLNVTAPNKVNYIKGEAFDPTGMVVTATYNDGTTAEVTDYRVAGFGESDEVNILEISYGGKAESIVVTIHDPGAWEVIKAPTCTEAGQEGRKCKECGDVIEIRTTNATGHSYGEWVVVKKASYTESGQEERICSKCDHKDKRSIPMLTRTSITKATVSGIAAKVYTGTAIVQSPVVKLNGKTLKYNTDYTVSYKNNKNVGTATLTITGKNAYKNTVSKSFVINPKAAIIKRPKAIRKGFTAKWSKQTVQTSGYELQYASNSKFTSGKKKVTIKKNTIVSKKVTKLKAKKKYYMRVRTFKTVSGKKYYSAWSKTKTVTTKK